MNLVKDFSERVKQYFKPATVKKAEFFDCFSRLGDELKKNLSETCVECSASDNSGKIIIDSDHKRIVLEASSMTMLDSLRVGRGEFLPSIACDHIDTAQIHNLTEAIKSDNIVNALAIVTTELKQPVVTSKPTTH